VSKSLYRLERSYRGVEGIAKTLNSNIKTGIEGTAIDIETRISRYGSNAQKPRKMNTFLDLVLECFEDTILKILIGAAVVSFLGGFALNGLSGCIEGCSILVSIVIIVVVTAVNNWIKEK